MVVTRSAVITAAEVAERIPQRPGIEPLSPPALERWLLDFDLAKIHDDGLLTPTEKAIAAAGALA